MMRSLATCRLRECDASKPRRRPSRTSDLFPACLVLHAHRDFNFEHLTVSCPCNVGSRTRGDGTDETRGDGTDEKRRLSQSQARRVARGLRVELLPL